MRSLITAGKNKLCSRLEKVRQKKKKVPETKSASTLMMLEVLPRELKQRVAFFLPHSDLLNLVQTSESTRSGLDLQIVSSPLTDRHSQSKLFRTPFERKSFAVVVSKPEARIHSIAFTSRVQSNRANPRVWIVEQDVPASLNPQNLKRGRFCDNNTVASLQLDGQRSLSLTFSVKPNKMYQFYIMTKAWGGGVRFSNMTLDRVGFGSKSTECISYQFDAFEDYSEHLDFDEVEVCR